MEFNNFVSHTFDTSYPIWWIENKELPIQLYWLNDANYYVIQQGALADILSNPLFLIIHDRLLHLFLDITGLDLQPSAVSIYDRLHNTSVEGYYNISAPKITLESLDKLDSSGNKIWIDQGLKGLFVSKSLKEQIETTGYDRIVFYPGYSMFAG